MHHENFSLRARADGLHKLFPGYDQLSMQLVIPDDDLAPPVRGRQSGLRRHDWLDLARYCGIPERVLARPVSASSDAKVLIQRCSLGEEMKQAYSALLDEGSSAVSA